MRPLAALAVVALVLAPACGGSSGRGGGDADTTSGDTALPVDVVTPADPVPADWQLLYGYDSDGTTWDQEGLIGLAATSDGGVVALAERRFRTDPGARDLLMLSVGSDGALASAQRLRFDDEVTPVAFRRFADGDLLLVFDRAELARVTSDGTVTWATSVDRDPYAFGGLEVTDVALADGGDVYLAGGFNPSEDGPDRTFVARVGAADGAVAWMRSWPRDQETSFGARVAVSDAGVFVADLVQGANEIDRRVALVGLSLDGAALGSVAFTMTTTDGTLGAFREVALAPRAGGVTAVGLRATAANGFAFHVYRLDLDASLAVTGQGVTLVTDVDSPFASDTRAAVGADGRLVAVMSRDSGAGWLFDWAPGSGVALAWQLGDADGGPLFVDDADLAPHVVLTAGGVVVGGTADTPGAARLVPAAVGAESAPLDLLRDVVTVGAETVVAEDATLGLTALDADDLGAQGEASDGDQDVLLFGVSP